MEIDDTKRYRIEITNWRYKPKGAIEIYERRTQGAANACYQSIIASKYVKTARLLRDGVELETNEER